MLPKIVPIETTLSIYYDIIQPENRVVLEGSYEYLDRRNGSFCLAPLHRHRMRCSAYD